MTRTRPKNRNRRQREKRTQEALGCPTPDKHGHPTEKAAEHTLSQMWNTPRPGKQYPTRAYHCECGNWHLTKATPRDHT